MGVLVPFARIVGIRGSLGLHPSRGKGRTRAGPSRRLSQQKRNHRLLDFSAQDEQQRRYGIDLDVHLRPTAPGVLPVSLTTS